MVPIWNEVSPEPVHEKCGGIFRGRLSRCGLATLGRCARPSRPSWPEGDPSQKDPPDLRLVRGNWLAFHLGGHLFGIVVLVLSEPLGCLSVCHDEYAGTLECVFAGWLLCAVVLVNIKMLPWGDLCAVPKVLGYELASLTGRAETS